MKLKEALCYKSSVVLGEEVSLSQLIRYNLYLLFCLSHRALPFSMKGVDVIH